MLINKKAIVVDIEKIVQFYKSRDFLTLKIIYIFLLFLSTYVYIYKYKYMYIYTYKYVCIHIHINAYVCTFINMYTLESF